MQEQEDFNATTHDVGVPDTAVQLKTNTKEKKASMLPPPSSIPRPSRTISEEKTLDTLDDVKEKGEDLGIGKQPSSNCGQVALVRVVWVL